MKIVDVSIFCADYEMDLLYLKLLLEAEYVDKFVIAECKYSYRGEEKGLVLAECLAKDKKFQKYLEKIHVINVEQNLSGQTYNKHLGTTVIDPANFGNAEVQLREAPTKYILENYPDDTRILVTDIDEVFDFTDPIRRDKIFSLFNSSDPLQIERIRYIYNGYNRQWRSDGDIISPSYTVSNIRNNLVRLSDKKWKGILIPYGDYPICFEYCFCFNYDALLRKFDSSLHTCWDRKLIDESLLCNFWTKTSYQGNPSLKNRFDWHEFVKLNQKNSPKYIRDHIEKFDFQLVPKDYRDNRLRMFSFCAVFPENKNIE